MDNILVTGFPGFIAGQLLERLAPHATSFDLLVEGRFEDRARRQVTEVAAAAGVDPDRFRVITGDITRAGLGLEPAVASRLKTDCDSVFHLAAIYDLAVAEDVAWKINVEGTQNVNDFVADLASLERYNYISTFAVAGKRGGVIREADLSAEAGFHNFYESTKYEAEVRVRRLADDGLPVSIYRPAVVVGDSRTGRTVKFDGPYMMLKVLRAFPWPLNRLNFGVPDVRFQMVPVDFIVDAISTLARDPRAAGKTFHLTDPGPYTVAEIAELFGKALNGSGSYFRIPTFATKLTTASGLLKPLGLQAEASPYFFHKATYDCINTLDLLDGTGVEVPRLEDYVGNLVRFFLENEKGELAA